MSRDLPKVGQPLIDRGELVGQDPNRFRIALRIADVRR